jgi:putative membrane protein
MRLLVILVLLVFAASGVVVGSLNADMVGYDLVLARVHVPKGAALLCALVIGWLLGGLTAWLGVVTRQRRERRRQQRDSEKKLPAAA